MQLAQPFVLRYRGKEVAQIVSEGVAIATPAYLAPSPMKLLPSVMYVRSGFQVLTKVSLSSHG